MTPNHMHIPVPCSAIIGEACLCSRLESIKKPISNIRQRDKHTYTHMHTHVYTYAVKGDERESEQKLKYTALNGLLLSNYSTLLPGYPMKEEAERT